MGVQGRRQRASTGRGRQRVLVIDEHDGSRIATSLALKTAGYACAQARTEADALALVSTFEPNAVVFECFPRGKSLLGFAERLRARAGNPGLVVVALSALEEPPGLRVRERLDGYVTKPFSLLDLKAALRAR